MSKNSHNQRTYPANDTKKKSKQTMSVHKPQTKDETSNQLPLLQLARQDQLRHDQPRHDPPRHDPPR